MQEPNRSSVEAVNPLIKLVKEREDLYFELLSFVNKNIQSSSNDLDNLTIFKKFIIQIKKKGALLRQKQNIFLKGFQDIFSEKDHKADELSTREMLRLSSRLIEILEASIAKARKSVFDDNGKANKQFNRFKMMLHKILKRETFLVKDYVEYIVNYCYTKYNKEILKIQKYVQKIQQGEDIFLRQLYFKESSDVEISPEKKRLEEVRVRVPEKKLEMTDHLSSTEEHEKKISLKKTLRSSLKKREKKLSKNKQDRQGQTSQPPTPRKQSTVNRLLKFYALLELNKRQFIEDYIYTQLQEQKHKAQLYSKLMERNKDINKQINCFVKKSNNYVPSPSVLVVGNIKGGSSDEDKKMERNQSISSKRSLRTSFIITKKKSNFQFQAGSSGTEKLDTERDFLEKTIKNLNLNLNPRRRTSHSNTRVPVEKSKKLFVVKAPMLFQQEIIPQAQITQTNWLQPSTTIKCKEKKNDNIRLKRKNNINPLQNTFLQQNFRYPL